MRILVVEEDKKVASFVEKGLREKGCAADVPHTGEDGGPKAAIYDCDHAILDVMLPGKSGFEIVQDGPRLLHRASGGGSPRGDRCRPKSP